MSGGIEINRTGSVADGRWEWTRAYVRWSSPDVGSEVGGWFVAGVFGEKCGSSDRTGSTVHSGICRRIGPVWVGKSDAEAGIQDVSKAWALVYSLAP